MRRIVPILLVASAAVAACTKAPSYDLVIANGRVMDPESGLDGVRHIGINAGKIAVVSETPLAGARVIDAANRVVSPGFIDLHEHGQTEESYRMMVRDGQAMAYRDIARLYVPDEPRQFDFEPPWDWRERHPR